MSTDPPNGLLMSSLRKMLQDYMAVKTPSAACKVIYSFSGTGPVPCQDWTPAYATSQAASTLSSIASQGQALAILGSIGFNGVAIPSQMIPAMQSCPDVVGLDLAEYAYLWAETPNQPFCRVKVGDIVNYNPISHVKTLQSSGSQDGPKAVGVIIDQYQAANTWIDPVKMREQCQLIFSYDNMMNQPFLQLCGCYLAVPMTTPPGFTSDEKQFLAQHPECNPTCLSAAVRYVAGVGGTPIPCQQNTCIADNINVTGATTSITQSCGQCTKRFQCVCYVHVNGQNIDNQTCNTVYVVDPNTGQITETINNQPPKAGSGLWALLQSMIHSKWAMVGLVIAVGLITIVVIVLLVVQHTRNNTKTRPVTIREPLGYAATTSRRSLPIAMQEPSGYAMTSRS